jgi:hypothetical protein
MFRFFGRVNEWLFPDPLKGMLIKYFQPEADITVSELAEIFSSITTGWCAPRCGVPFRPDTWDELLPGIRRHFKDMPQ